MSTFPFRLLSEDSLVVVDGTVNGYAIRLAIDTGASHSVIHFPILFIAGHFASEIQRTVQFETAQGVVDAGVIQVRELQSLGIVLTNFPIASYDFIEHGLLPEFDGVLGLDFFKGKKVCFDFGKSMITVEDSPPTNS